MSENVRRLKGLLQLLGSAVENGASAVERVHKATARTTFNVLENTPGIAGPASVVDEAQDAVVSTVYESIRVVTRAVVVTLDKVLDTVDDDGDALVDENSENPEDAGDEV